MKQKQQSPALVDWALLFVLIKLEIIVHCEVNLAEVNVKVECR